MNHKTEQNPATKAIAEIKEQIQLDQWPKDLEDRQAVGLSIDGGVFGAYASIVSARTLAIIKVAANR